jgi:hypothetical protein
MLKIPHDEPLHDCIALAFAITTFRLNILSDCKNIYKNLDANFFLKTFLKEPNDKASECDKINISALQGFFKKSYNNLQEIANKINPEEIKNGINETNEILQNPYQIKMNT